jgi:subtilisin family serine protease
VSLLHANNVAVVASAGNHGPGADTEIVAPACLTNTISVGATTDTDTIAGYSYVPPYLDLFAPGGANTGTGHDIETSAVGGGFVETAGTSFAAPHVSGAFALLRAASSQSTVDTLENALKTTGVPIQTVHGPVPRINVNAALGAVADTTPPTTPGSFTATGTGSGTVVLTWTASTDAGGVAYYEIFRRASRNGPFTHVQNVVSATSYTDMSNLAASKMYEYRIVAVDQSANSSGAAFDFAVTVVFPDDAVVKGAHIARLREAADAWREFAGLARLHASYPPLTGVIVASHLAGTSTSVREALNAARQAMSLPLFAYSGVPAPAPGQVHRLAHVQQLRDAMK